MTITFFSVYLNHHQANLADELYNMLGSDYTFVEIAPCLDSKGSDTDYSRRPYLLKAWESDASNKRAFDLSVNSDVCIYCGYEALSYEIPRIKKGLFTLEADERWLKRGLLNLLSPRLIRSQWYYHTTSYNKPVYKLCASAFCARDLNLMRSFKNRCYKWGYFTRVDNFDTEDIRVKSDNFTIIWCARFLTWKHPEHVVNLAKMLKDNGFNATIDMYGEGPRKKWAESLCRNMQVDDMINFKGVVPNSEILKSMREHDIFLFTSDKNEGWGAVLNEAMSSGCAVVASDAIGSVPYLINNGENGFIFHSGNLSSLYKKVTFLLNDRELCKSMGIKAYKTMRNLWSPQNAAKNLLYLINDLKQGKDTSVIEGPCSKA